MFDSQLKQKEEVEQQCLMNLTIDHAITSRVYATTIHLRLLFRFQ